MMLFQTFKVLFQVLFLGIMLYSNSVTDIQRTCRVKTVTLPKDLSIDHGSL